MLALRVRNSICSFQVRLSFIVIPRSSTVLDCSSNHWPKTGPNLDLILKFMYWHFDKLKLMLFSLLQRNIESRSCLIPCAFPRFSLYNNLRSSAKRKTMELKTVSGKSLMKKRKVGAQVLSPEVHPRWPANSSILDFQFSRIAVCRSGNSLKSRSACHLFQCNWSYVKVFHDQFGRKLWKSQREVSYFLDCSQNRICISYLSRLSFEE